MEFAKRIAQPVSHLAERSFTGHRREDGLDEIPVRGRHLLQRVEGPLDRVAIALGAQHLELSRLALLETLKTAETVTFDNPPPFPSLLG